ncbi:MAG TPA: hypothetical protein VKD91_04150 [Pyrinomonadaceae bacterium]|nr:hypothetical protein [Pyrinomonadaceae bacterium]
MKLAKGLNNFTPKPLPGAKTKQWPALDQLEGGPTLGGSLNATN